MVTRAGARRTATLVAAAALAAIGVGAASLPAYAADDRVSVRASRSFTPGGDGGSVAVSVNKRTKGCVAVRVVLGIQLDGLEANQVRVIAQTGGGWQDVGVSGGGGGVTTGQVAPERQRLCERQTATVRYRVAFAEDVSGEHRDVRRRGVHRRRRADRAGRRREPDQRAEAVADPEAQ